ncbi:hypothetical protein C0J52_21069 [Blattella germanica]|nr:hypothetical protein C0J52_21069 [Blattella germanica]
MADDVLLSVHQSKGRSASICAPGFSSMEAMAAANAGTPPLATGSSTPEASGTPSGRRRRPATRSQSARVPGGRSVRRKAVAAAAAEAGTMRSGTSEPRLHVEVPTIATPDASPGMRRKGSTRRSVHQSQPRKSTAFLDVPDAGGCPEDEDEDSYRLRSFSFTSKESLKTKNIPEENSSISTRKT